MTKSKIKEQIKYWKEVFVPTGNMGKWYASVRVEKLTEQLEKRINKRKKSR
jgi:ribosomal protein L9